VAAPSATALFNSQLHLLASQLTTNSQQLTTLSRPGGCGFPFRARGRCSVRIAISKSNSTRNSELATRNSRPSVFCRLSFVLKVPPVPFVPVVPSLSTRRPTSFQSHSAHRFRKVESVHTFSLFTFPFSLPQASRRPTLFFSSCCFTSHKTIVNGSLTTRKTFVNAAPPVRTRLSQEWKQSTTFHFSFFTLTFSPPQPHNANLTIIAHAIRLLRARPSSGRQPRRHSQSRRRRFPPSPANHVPRAIPSRRPMLIPLRALGSPTRPHGHPAALAHNQKTF